jgi:hypothetical protein
MDGFPYITIACPTATFFHVAPGLKITLLTSASDIPVAVPVVVPYQVVDPGRMVFRLQITLDPDLTRPT